LRGKDCNGQHVAVKTDIAMDVRIKEANAMGASKSHIALTLFLVGCLHAQQSSPANSPSVDLPAALKVELTVPKGEPISIALESEVRIRKVGQPVSGRVTRPVYVFDHLVIPAGTEVAGRIKEIGPISRKTRVLGVMNGNLTPVRAVKIEFNELRFAGGERKDLRVEPAVGSSLSLRLVSGNAAAKNQGSQGVVSSKIRDAQQEVRRQWRNALSQIEEPGKMHRLTRYAVARLPAHPQYLAAGTAYFSELREPLCFGEEFVAGDRLSAVGRQPADGTVIHALLTTPVNSATTAKGEEIEAVLSQPLFDGDRLILPQGTRLRGLVTQVRAARRLKHNGQLRLSFRSLVLPDGIEQRVVANLQGIQTREDDHVTLDSEGGARTTSPGTRYLSTAISLGLATAAFHQDTDGEANSLNSNATGGAGNAAAGGAVGFGLLGIATGALARSQPLGMAMGAYGASRSIYSNFLGRGRDIAFPRNTEMEIEIGARKSVSGPLTSEQDSAQTPEVKRRKD
jgi:hypothetical protein